MGAVIGEVLPLALGVAISPIPIIAAILMLLSPRAKVTGVGFLLGWIIGIVVAVIVFTALSTVLPAEDPAQARPIRGAVQLVLGALLIVMAVGQWRKRPRQGAEPVLPKWMEALDTISFPLAAGFGFLLAAVNPKNLLMAVGAGTAIGAGGLDGGATTVVIVVYTLLAGSTVLVPVTAYLVAAERLRGPLDALHHWLGRENAVIMSVLLLVIGVSMLGKGIGSF